MNLDISKKVAVICVILGALLGLITIIPYINLFAFLFLTFLAAPAVIIYAKTKNIIGNIDTREGAICGAVIGAIVFSAFFIVFVPISAFVGLFYKEGVYMVMKIFFSSGAGFMTMIFSYIMIGLMVALFNAFSGIFTAYIYQQIKNITKEENQTFKIEN